MCKRSVRRKATSAPGPCRSSVIGCLHCAGWVLLACCQQNRTTRRQHKHSASFRHGSKPAIRAQDGNKRSRPQAHKQLPLFKRQSHPTIISLTSSSAEVLRCDRTHNRACTERREQQQHEQAGSASRQCEQTLRAGQRAQGQQTAVTTTDARCKQVPGSACWLVNRRPFSQSETFE